MNDKLESMVLALLAATTGEDMETLNAESSIYTVKNWDSVGHINLVLAIEKEFGVELDPVDAMELTSVSQMVAYLNNVD
jgi:acyl carrier protein